MKVYPVAGRLVRDPENGREIADPDGVEKSDSDPFWIRRLADGDVSNTPQPSIDADQDPAEGSGPNQPDDGAQ